MMPPKKRVVFLGTSDFSVPILKRLIEKEEELGLELVAVFTRPDRRCGRGLSLCLSSVKRFLNNFLDKKRLKRLAIYQPENFQSRETIKELRALSPDFLILASYGVILPKEVLDIPPLGSLNVHPSLLPKYRGPSPIQTAIYNQDKETGVSIMRLSLKMDAGAILKTRSFKMPARITAPILEGRLAFLGADLIEEILPDFIKGDVEYKEQDKKAVTFCKIIQKEDGLIDWSKSAAAIDAQIRAFIPWPGSYTFFKARKKEIKIEIIESAPVKKNKEWPALKLGQVYFQKKEMKWPVVKTGEGFLEIEIIKPEGKNEMSANSFINGYPEFIGTILKNK